MWRPRRRRHRGQQGEDLLFGEQGHDILDGGVAGCCDTTVDTRDVLAGGPGDDELHCADFPQAGCSLYGEQGDDTIYIVSAPQAIGGRNFAFGGNGNDTLHHLAGEAMLDGGNGDDLLISQDGSGSADIDGGRGVDVCVGGGTTTRCEG